MTPVLESFYHTQLLVFGIVGEEIEILVRMRLLSIHSGLNTAVFFHCEFRISTRTKEWYTSVDLLSWIYCVHVVLQRLSLFSFSLCIRCHPHTISHYEAYILVEH